MTEPEKPDTPIEPPQPEAATADTPTEPVPQQPLERPRKSGIERMRPDYKPGKPPAVAEDDQGFGGGPKIRDLDAQIEKELEEAMAGFSESDMKSQTQAARPARPVPGAERKLMAKVIAVRLPDVFLSVPGGRSEGVLPLLQFPEGPPAIGTEVEVQIEGYDRADGLLRLTRKGAVQHADWSSVAEGMIVEAKVTGTNTGGLSVDVNGIRGFLPISQLELFRVEDTAPYVNQRLRCMVTEVSPEERNLIVSRRAVLEKDREDAREKLWATLAEGQVHEGIVRNIKDFGAFVDLGGVDGLLPIGEMSWVRLKRVEDVLQLGQKLKVVVVRLDPERRKVTLGLKQLTPGPWDDIEQKYPVGLPATGKVSRIADFGAFVELEPGIEGLIHISELSPTRVRRVIDVVKPDQDVEVMVLSIDAEQRRMSLSLKAIQQLKAKQEAAAAAANAPPPEEPEPEEPTPPPKPRVRKTPLRGGTGDRPGGLFGEH